MRFQNNFASPVYLSNNGSTLFPAVVLLLLILFFFVVALKTKKGNSNSSSSTNNHKKEAHRDNNHNVGDGKLVCLYLLLKLYLLCCLEAKQTRSTVPVEHDNDFFDAKVVASVNGAAGEDEGVYDLPADVAMWAGGSNENGMLLLLLLRIHLVAYLEMPPNTREAIRKLHFAYSISRKEIGGWRLYMKKISVAWQQQFA